ncbi:MAG: immune inhibitor A [Deltaproteobacteria bacterium]|nr:immune inhibitor A [Deltaproteobacteria bacterium]
MSVSPDAGPTQDEHPNGNRDECILTYDDSHVCDAVNTKTIQNIGNVSITIATFNDCGQITICPQEVVVLDSATADYLLRAGPTLFEDTATPDVDAGFLSDAGGVHQSESDGGLDAGLVSDAGSSHQPGTDGGVINRCDRIRYDFETDDGGFLTGGNPPTLWQWGTPHRGQGPGGAANGSKCWGTNLSQNYPDDANATLTMPILHLSAGTTPVLQFQQWLQTESCCDAGVVEASIDAGRTWIALQEFRGNAALAWTPVSIDLSSLAGNDVTIRWHFRSDGSVTYPGWYVDDVQITGLSCFDSADAGSTGQSVDGGAISGNP